jgi:hypothetical protein
MGFAHRAFVAAGVGFAALVIAGCGSSGGGSLLSGAQANNLTAQLNRVTQALDNQNCAAAQQYLQDFQTSVENMGGVNATLVSNLTQGVVTVESLANRDCHTATATTPHKTHTRTQATTTTTATETTTTFTNPTTSYTQPTYTQPTETTTTSTTTSNTTGGGCLDCLPTTSSTATGTDTTSTSTTTTPSGGGGLGGVDTTTTTTSTTTSTADTGTGSGF